MPIRELSVELVLDIIESYGQITKLNLSTNEISRVENLEHLTSLTSLDLFCNRLGSDPGSLDGLSPLTGLKDLDISENVITSLEPLSAAPASLLRLNVANNSVTDIGEVSFLAPLTALTELVLVGNPMAEEESYRGRVLAVLPSLVALDHAPTEDHRHDTDEGDGRLLTRPANVFTTADGIASRATSLEPHPGDLLNAPPPPPNSSQPRPTSGSTSVPAEPSVPAVPSSLDDESGEYDNTGGVGGQTIPPQDQSGGIEWQDRKDQFENQSAEQHSALPVPASSSPAVSVPVLVAAAGVLQTEGVLPQAAAAAGGEFFRGGRVLAGESAAAASAHFPEYRRNDEPDGAAADGQVAGKFETESARPAVRFAGGGGKPLPVAAVAVSEARMHDVVRSRASSALTECENGGDEGRDGASVFAERSAKIGARGGEVSSRSPAPRTESVAAPEVLRQCDASLSGHWAAAAAESAAAVTVGLPETRPPEMIAIAAAVPRRISTEATADAPSEGRVFSKTTTSLIAARNDDRVRQVETVAADAEGRRGPKDRTESSPGVSASVESTVRAGSEASTLAFFSREPDEGSHRSSHDGGATEGQLARGAVLLRPQVPLGGGNGSKWESVPDGHHSTIGGFPFDHGTAADGGGLAAAPVFQATNGRAKEGRFGAPSGDRRRVVLAAAAAATTAAGGGSSQSDREAAAGSRDEAHGVIFGRRGSSAAHTAKHDEQRSHASHHPAGRRSGVGVAGASAESGGNKDPSLWLGRGGVEAPELPRQAAPLSTGRKEISFGVQALRKAPECVERRWTSEGEGYDSSVTVDRREWEALRRENNDLRRQAALTYKRCAALMEMQRLADDALSSAYPPPFSSSSNSHSAAMTAADKHRRRQQQQAASNGAFSLSSSSSGSEEGPEDRSREQSDIEEEGNENNSQREGENEDSSFAYAGGDEAQVAKLLATWRGEVLKLLLQRGVDAEVAAEESREAGRKVSEAKEARGRAETEAKSLTQRALAAEAEAELSGIKLTRAFEELRDDRTGRHAAEASSMGYAVAVRSLQEWVQGFVGRASEGLFEREALLARGVAKLEAFSERLSQASGRIQVLGTLLRHKEVQLRNSRAALAADRRVWLLERRDRETAALSKALPLVRRGSRPVAPSAPRQKKRSPGGGGGSAGGGGARDPSWGAADGEGPSSGDDEGVDGAWGVFAGGGQAAAPAAPAVESPLLEGLRPECEAVMRALFCRVDRLGTGAVRARRLLDVLRSDCGVSEVMEAAVGKSRWRAALDSMEAALCPPPLGVATAVAGGGGGGGSGSRGVGGEVRNESGAVGPRAERDVTWGEFLLFFLPSAGSADDAYNAGLVAHAGSSSGGNGRSGSGRCGFATSTPPAGIAFVGTGGGARPLSSNSFGAVSQDAAAMLQMVLPAQWTAGAGEGGDGGPGGSAPLGRGLAALSVGQLRREVLRLAKERAFLMALVREDGRLGKRRAEAVHDQYRHELRALHTKITELERSLEEASHRADAEHERGTAVTEEVSRVREEAKRAEREWNRRLDAAVQEKSLALAESSRKASEAETAARERISRLEAEHSLALRENGKVSVRQRALERELARIKNSMQAEATLEKEALEERLRAGESKLATARRERNALLAALRDLQRRGRLSAGGSSDLFSPSLPPPTDLGVSRGGGGGLVMKELGEATDGGDGGGGDGGGGGSVGGKAVGGGEILRERTSPPLVVSALAAGGSGIECSQQEDVPPEVVESRAFQESPVVEGERTGDGVGLRSRGEAWQGAVVEGCGRGGGGDDGRAGRAASLTARLEFLALQTQQLLADGSDTSCSSSDDDFG